MATPRRPVRVAAALAAMGLFALLAVPARADLTADRQLRLFVVAGSGSSRYTGDGGPATAAGLRGVVGVAALADGSFLISTRADGRVRHVAADGTITTVAGNGQRGFSGDGGPATRASLTAGPLAPAPDGGFYIATATA